MKVPYYSPEKFMELVKGKKIVNYNVGMKFGEYYIPEKLEGTLDDIQGYQFMSGTYHSKKGVIYGMMPISYSWTFLLIDKDLKI